MLCMKTELLSKLSQDLAELKKAGLFKNEYEIATPQSSHIELANGKPVLNFCANNYLGLADNPEVIEAAKKSYEKYGFGLASVRFICGTQTIHLQLEKRISEFLGTEDTILYSSCFDANGGLFETILGPEDAIISDALNHASIIDGCRLAGSRIVRYAHCDADDLERAFNDEKGKYGRALVVTDGVFSMDGDIAPLPALVKLAEKYEATLIVDDAHAVGVIGEDGSGTAAHFGLQGKIDLQVGTMSKALAAEGGYVAGKKIFIDYLV